MNNDRPRLIIRCLALAAAVGGHVLLFVLFTLRPASIPSQTDAQTASLVFLEEPELWQAEELPAIEVPDLTLSGVPPPEGIDTGIAPSTAIEVSPASPRIDWREEAKRVAESKAPELLEQLGRKCDPDERGFPPECDRRKYEFKWDPEPSRVGMAGPLPYVRVGERCIVGLGFFACALGALPGPNGDLFETMRDPDRPRSSVPDLPR